jgi:hypothetical protein
LDSASPIKSRSAVDPLPLPSLDPLASALGNYQCSHGTPQRRREDFPYCSSTTVRIKFKPLQQAVTSMTAFTIYFAQLAGLWFIILGIILIVRKAAIIDLMPKMAENQPFVFLAGMIRIIVGLAVLIGNGPWGNQALSIVVALIGWITLVRGVAMLLVAPQQQRKLIDLWRREATYYTAAAIVLGLGLYLARAGFAV